MALRVNRSLLTEAADLQISSNSEKLQQVDFISFTSKNDVTSSGIVIYSTTTDTSTFPSGKVPLHQFTISSKAPKIFTKEDFPLGDFNSYIFGDSATDNKLYAAVAGPNVIVHYSVTDVGVSADYTTEQLQDIVGAMVDGGTETNIAVTYDDTAGKLNFVSVDTNTQLPLIDSDTMTGALSTNVASAESVKAYVDAEVAAVVDTAPATLNTLNELAAALNDDANFSTTVTTSLGLKAPTASPTFTGTIAIPNIANIETAIAANTLKTSFPGFGTSGSTALVGNTALLQLGTSSTTALAGDTALLQLGTSGTTALAGNTTTISSGQASAISANTLKNTNVVGDLSFTAVATKLQINTTNGASISIPAATNTSWGAMSDDLVIALEANTAKPSFPAAVSTGNILWKQAKVVLTEAQLNNMHNTAIMLIAHAGTDTIIMVGDAIALIDRDTGTAQSAAVDLCIGYNGTTVYSESILYERRFMYNENGDRTWQLKADYSGEIGASLTAAVDKDVTAAFTGAITSGSLNSITLYIQYYIIDNS